MKRIIQNASPILLALVVGLGAAMVQAKLPPPAPLTDEQKAKAEEAKAKAAEAAKTEAELLAKYQDKAAANHKARVAAKPAATAAAPAAPAAPAAAAAPAAPAKKP